MFSFGFQVVNDDMHAKEMMKPTNSHIFMMYQYSKKVEENNEYLHEVLRPIKQVINDIFERKLVVTADGVQIKFKEVLVSCDLDAWIHLMGIHQVWSANYNCGICLVNFHAIYLQQLIFFDVELP
jgi:hypothetical protein